jgi:uncharacterized protein
MPEELNLAALYVTSLERNSGKTMLCAGLGKHWMEMRKKVGYLRLFSPEESGNPDKDGLFMQKVLDLPESVESLCAVVNTAEPEAIRSISSRISQGKDVVLIEGLPLNASFNLVETLGAKVIVLHDYSADLRTALPEYKNLAGSLLGMVVNKVPLKKVSLWQSRYSAELAGAGINLLGIIPENRILMALSISDLAEALQGRILNNSEKVNDLIENLMMGSSTFDRGPAYYTRKVNKAVMLWGERPGFRKAALANLVLSALQTSTRCIVISHDGSPVPAAAKLAGEKQIPIISAPGTLSELVTRLEGAMSHLKFNQEQKLPKLLEILNQSFSFDRLSQDLDLNRS